jgi:hypothetical protein
MTMVTYFEESLYRCLERTCAIHSAFFNPSLEFNSRMEISVDEIGETRRERERGRE